MGLNAKLADFGEATRFDTQAATQSEDGALSMTIVGTPAYCAPELARGEPYTTAVDVFSWGVTALVIGHYDESKFIKRQMRTASYMNAATRSLRPSDNFVEKRDGLWNLIQRCWRQHWPERPTFVEIVRDLEGSFEVGKQ